MRDRQDHAVLLTTLVLIIAAMISFWPENPTPPPSPAPAHPAQDSDLSIVLNAPNTLRPLPPCLPFEIVLRIDGCPQVLR